MDSWSSEAIWAEFLLNVKIVVSTYEILNQALTHAFVKLESLALIVFDEGTLSSVLQKILLASDPAS